MDTTSCDLIAHGIEYSDLTPYEMRQLVQDLNCLIAVYELAGRWRCPQSWPQN